MDELDQLLERRAQLEELEGVAFIELEPSPGVLEALAFRALQQNLPRMEHVRRGPERRKTG